MIFSKSKPPSIMNKLGLQNRAELVAYAVQQGLLSGGEPK